MGLDVEVLSPFLDRRMMFPLLEYLDSLINAGTCAYQPKDVAAARLVLLRPTHMVDYAIDIYKNLHPRKRKFRKKCWPRKKRFYQDLEEELEKACQPLEDLAQNREEKVRRTTHHYYTCSRTQSFCVVHSSPANSHPNPQAKLVAAGMWNIGAIAAYNIYPRHGRYLSSTCQVQFRMR
jgi:hypothetical protein